MGLLREQFDDMRLKLDGSLSPEEKLRLQEDEKKRKEKYKGFLGGLKFMFEVVALPFTIFRDIYKIAQSLKSNEASMAMADASLGSEKPAHGGGKKAEEESLIKVLKKTRKHGQSNNWGSEKPLHPLVDKWINANVDYGITKEAEKSRTKPSGLMGFINKKLNRKETNPEKKSLLRSESISISPDSPRPSLDSPRPSLDQNKNIVKIGIANGSMCEITKVATDEHGIHYADLQSDGVNGRKKPISASEKSKLENCMQTNTLVKIDSGALIPQTDRIQGQTQTRGTRR